jgi:hypothetical protein
MELNFSQIIETLADLQQSKNLQFITTKRLRKMLEIPGEDLKTVRLIANTLSWLEMHKFLELIEKYPKLYRLQPDFAEKARFILRMYQH